MNFLRTLFEKQRCKKQHQKELGINATFYLRERDGSLWILHEGHAIQEISKDKTAEEIVQILNNYRSTAIKY